MVSARRDHDRYPVSLWIVATQSCGHGTRLTDDAIRNTIRSIHLNPVRRGLVDTPEDWEWSSARQYRGDRADQLPIDCML